MAILGLPTKQALRTHTRGQCRLIQFSLVQERHRRQIRQDRTLQHATQQHALSGVGWLSWAGLQLQVTLRYLTGSSRRGWALVPSEYHRTFSQKKVPSHLQFSFIGPIHAYPLMRLNPALSLSAHSRHRRPQLHIPPLSLKRSPSSRPLGHPRASMSRGQGEGKEDDLFLTVLYCTVILTIPGGRSQRLPKATPENSIERAVDEIWP